MSKVISAADTYARKRVSVLDSEMAYVDVGTGDPVVFLHGNPTSSYLWRNVIAEVEPDWRCLAPDLIGMGDSGKNPSGSYRLVDHAKYLDAWFAKVGLDKEKNLTLVIHDWGSALGFRWAQNHREQIRGLVYMEAIVCPMTWETFPDAARKVFQGFRSPAGEGMVLENNVFVERVLPGSVVRELCESEMAIYRKPFVEAGESRRPTLTWPREIPIEGEPADVVDIVEAYGSWLSESQVAKLFINADPGALLTGAQREYCRAWPNQQEVTVNGTHFIQEDSPQEIGGAIVQFLKNI